LKQEWAMEKDNGFDYNFLMIFRYLLFVVVLQFLTRLMWPCFFGQVGCHWYC
jgi:hypothetical protein